jgi:hypothetical protein
LIQENGVASSSKTWLTSYQWMNSNVPEDIHLENLFFSIVVIRKEWGKFKLLSYHYTIVFSSYSEMVQKTQKKMICLDLSKNKWHKLGES